MKKRTAALLTLCAVLPAVSAYALTDIIMRAALDRNQPRGTQLLIKLFKGNRHEEDAYNVFIPYLERLKELPHETVEVLAPDGVKLVGHWFAKEKPKRVILASHGWRSAWNRDFCRICEFWDANDCSVLYIEQRGQGESGGDHVGFGLLEHKDLPVWLRWIVERCGKEIPIYLCGISMGATTVLMAADMPLPGNVRGIIADCGFTSPDAIWRFVTRRDFHLPYFLTGISARRLSRKRLGQAPDAKSTVMALRHSRYPVLFIHGLDDSFVPPSMTYENYDACTAPKRMLLVPGAIHAMSYVVMQEEYETIVKQFWDDYDR